MNKTIKREEVENALKSLVTNIKEDITTLKRHNSINNFISSTGREQGLYSMFIKIQDKKELNVFRLGMLMGLKQALEEIGFFEDALEEMDE